MLFALLICHHFLAPLTWLTPKIHDFGSVTIRKESNCEFRFKNETTEPIVIDNVRTTCGCTAPEWSDAPVMPDSIGSIKIAFFPRESGSFEKRIKVWLHHYSKPEILTIKGTVGEE